MAHDSKKQGSTQAFYHIHQRQSTIKTPAIYHVRYFAPSAVFPPFQ